MEANFDDYEDSATQSESLHFEEDEFTQGGPKTQSGFTQGMSQTQITQMTQMSQLDDMDEFQPQEHKHDFHDQHNHNHEDSMTTQDNLRFVDDDEEGSQEPKSLVTPNYQSCFYCGCQSVSSVVKCGECGKWFCNGRGGTSGSHIVHHLVKSRHKEIILHPKSALGDTQLECYICGCKNIFLLGFVASKKNTVVVLLCRECAYGSDLDHLDWNVDQWTPLINDRSILPWLVKFPEGKELSRIRNVSPKDIDNIESLLKRNPNATFEDLGTMGVLEEEFSPVQFTYEDGYKYKAILSPLVKLEAKYDKSMKESQSMANVKIYWILKIPNDGFTDPLTFEEEGENEEGTEKQIVKPLTAKEKKKLADKLLRKGKVKFCFVNPRADQNYRLAPGDELQISLPTLQSRLGGLNKSQDWKCVGHVIKIDQEKIFVELKINGIHERKKVPIDTDEGFEVEFVWKSTSFDRMLAALNQYAINESSLSSYLYHKVLGHKVETEEVEYKLPKQIQAPGLPKLNHSQINAIKSVFKNPLTLIQGPPGTGKTITSATLCYHLSKENQNKHGRQVLICAPSNVAVDQLAEKINETGLKVVRVCAKSREEIQSPVEFLTLHYLLEHLPKEHEYTRLRTKMSLKGDLSLNEEKRLHSEKKRAEKKILKNADVICCTCVGAGDPRLSSYTFHNVIIDESTQSTEAECIIPIVKGAKKLILVGDHCQLGPVIMCKDAANAGLGRSLFERLVMLGNKPVRLAVQYRMHPALSEFCSNTFYEGALQNGITSSERLITNIEFPWPIRSKPMFFYNSIGEEEFSSSGTSYLNRIEAQTVEKIVTMLLKGGVIPSQLGVITPYEGQRSFIVKQMQRAGSLRSELYSAIEVASVDSFQGREKDFIILSAVRSNTHQGIGFLSDPRRLNVALSRSKSGLIIIGNASVLAKHPLWNLLLSHFKKNNLLVEGPLQHMKQSTIVLHQPKNFRRRFGVSLVNEMISPQEMQEQDKKEKSEKST